MATSHVAGRTLKDPAINVEEIDLKGVFGGGTISCLFSIFEMIALCFQNGRKKLAA